MQIKTSTALHLTINYEDKPEKGNDTAINFFGLWVSYNRLKETLIGFHRSGHKVLNVNVTKDNGNPIVWLISRQKTAMLFAVDDSPNNEEE